MAYVLTTKSVNKVEAGMNIRPSQNTGLDIKITAIPDMSEPIGRRGHN